MRTAVAALLFVAAATLAGCGGIPYSDPYASPDFSKKDECERAGGRFHHTTSVCEYPRR